jgi:hypothetical protein
MMYYGTVVPVVRPLFVLNTDKHLLLAMMGLHRTAADWGVKVRGKVFAGA